MTIDDELILALLEPQKDGKVGNGAPITFIVRALAGEIEYKLEEIDSFYLDHDAVIKKEKTYISPDVTVFVTSVKERKVAIEIENDLKWDFMESMQQVKKYKNKMETKVIIPDKYSRFAPLYENEGFRVYLWKAIRRWQCMKCGTEIDKEGPIAPKCPNNECKNHNPNDFNLVGLKNPKFEEFEKY
jgi:hypothetical protein